MTLLPEPMQRLLWRMSRKMYLAARDEPVNTIGINGEAVMLAAALRGAKAQGVQAPVLIDVGANLGEWTATALSCADQAGVTDARVHAFEPTAAIAAAFRRRHAAAIERGAVALVETAVGARTGTVTFAVAEGMRGTNAIATGETAGVEVPLTTVDAYMAERAIGRALFVKVDTEGNDANVIEGAMGALKSGRIDVLQFEYNYRWVEFRRFLKDVYDLVQGTEYTVAKLGATRASVYPEWHFELERFIECNFVLIHARAMDWLPLRRGRFDAANTYA
jgi:FkbM family methyltransferase